MWYFVQFFPNQLLLPDNTILNKVLLAKCLVGIWEVYLILPKTWGNCKSLFLFFSVDWWYFKERFFICKVYSESNSISFISCDHSHVMMWNNVGLVSANYELAAEHYNCLDFELRRIFSLKNLHLCVILFC